MVIRSSSTRDVQPLIADLRHGDPVAREAAIARLRVLGNRAVPRLIALVREDAQPVARASALKALDGMSDERIAEVAIHALSDAEVGVRLAAVATLRGLVMQETGVRVMDALASLAVDSRQSPTVREAAREALAQLPAELVDPLLAQSPADAAAPSIDDPREVRDWVARHGDSPLASLHDLVIRTREREQAETRSSWKREWIATRGAVHAALARRGSLIALYDLREAFELAPQPLPLDFLAGMTAIGDATCLEPMALAWSRAPVDSAWRTQLAQSAAAIVKRVKLTARNPLLKRLRKRWPEFV